MNVDKGFGRARVRRFGWALAAAALILGVGGATWRWAGAQQAAEPSGAVGAAKPQVQPAEVGSPTDPGPRQRVQLPVPKDPKLPTLFLVGDSTVRNGQGNGAGGQWGWGEPLVDDFDPAKINVVNRAIGGLSSRTYMNRPNGDPWAATLAMVKPGDVVVIQFGHNDGGVPDDASRARASLPGVGEETLEIENPILKVHETVHTYGWYIRKIVEDAKAKGATPIVCSLIPRKIWKDGKVARNKDDFAGWAQQVAVQEHVGFLDLNEAIARRYDALGEAAVEPLFGDPHTHTSRAGAELNAEVVVSCLKALKNDPVAGDFSAKGMAVAAYRE
ncbi:MAG: GDSL-type esterase/lipase family protein [Acidobacteriaceae bacterium]|jgi:lysophospholipase L1-like esterase